MQIQPFKLERYFARYEFSARYLLCSSDCDGLSQKWLVDNADDQLNEQWNNLHLGYTESLGAPLLREEVAQLYQGISPDQVLIIAPEEGIFITFNCILNKGDHVICAFPGYQSLYSVSESLGCEVTKWQPDEKKSWQFSIEELEKSIKPNTKLIVVNFPHNPTGYLPTKKELEEIIDVAKEHNLYLFSDEMYRLLEYDPEDRLSSACEKYEKAVSLFGMSKTFGMAGVRIGWVITRDKNLYQKMATFKDFTTICSSAPSELLSIMAIRARDEIISNHLTRIKRNLKLLDAFFAKHSNLFTWVRPKAGTIAFPKLTLSKGSYDFCEEVVKESGVMLLPSNVYDFDDKHVRVGFGRENMPEALEIFEQYLAKKSL